MSTRCDNWIRSDPTRRALRLLASLLTQLRLLPIARNHMREQFTRLPVLSNASDAPHHLG